MSARGRRGGASRAAVAAVLAIAIGAALAAWLALGHRGARTRDERPRPEHRVLVVGWDGATWRLLDPLLAAGRLPSLARLIARGSSARLESTVVPISSAAWVGAVTGKHPGLSGVYGFFETVPQSYDVRVISSRSVRATPLWRILARHGMHSIVFGVPVTYPPEPLPGVMVAGMLSPLDADYAWPPGLADDLRARGFVPDLGVWRAEQPLTPERIERQLDLERRILLELLAGEDWDMAMVVFKSLDVLSHQTYDGSLDGPVAKLCERLDAVLGELVAAVGPDTNVILLSDHGFQAYPRAFSIDEWLAAEGYAVRRPDAGSAPGAGGPLATRRAEENRQRLDALDLERTRAWAPVAEGNFGSVRLNLAGREPRGCVAPADAGALLDEIASKLCELRLPDGAPLVTRVLRGAELYPGPYVGGVPDLLFETAPSVVVRAVPAPAIQADLGGRTFPDHDLYGVLVGAGPSLATRTERGEASIFDLAPTALALLGLPVYAEMTGRPAAALFARPPEPELVPEERDAAGAGPAEPGLTPEEQREIRKRLENVGYVD